MKVPTYEKQTGLTNQTGGMRFTVNASPDQFAQESNAKINMANQLESTFTKLYENEVKVERAGQLTKAQNEWTKLSNTNEMASTNLQKEKVLSNYTSMENKIFNNSLSSISDKVVQKRFASWRASENMEYKKRLNKGVRVRVIDEAKANKMVEADKHIATMTNNNSNKLAYKKAEDYLFGDRSIVTIEDGKTIVSPSWKTFMIGANLMNPTAFEAFKKKTYNKVTRNKVQKLYSLHGQNNDTTGVQEVLAKLQDVNNGDFAKLDFVTRQKLVETGLRLEDTIDRRLISLQSKTAKNDKNVRQKKHASGLSKFLVQIQKSKVGADSTNSDTTNKTNFKLPTNMELITALEKDNISVKGYTMVSKLITGDNAEANDPIVVVEFLKDLNNADTPNQIDDILLTYSGKIGINGGLTLGTYNAQVNMAQQYKDKTPFSQQVKLYGTALNKVIGESNTKLMYGNGSENPDRDARAAEAIMMYHQKVNDDKNPLDPRQAYLETIENWRQAVKAELRTTMISPKVLSMMNLKTDFTSIDIQEWTPEKFTKAIDMVANVPNRNINEKTKVSFGANGMTAVEKALEIQKIRLIANEIQMEQDVKNSKAGGKLLQNNEDSVEKKNGMWDFLPNWMQNDDDKRKKLLETQNPRFPTNEEGG